MAAAPLTPEQQAIVILQQELAQTRQTVDQVSNAHNALRAAHDALNLSAQQALAEKDQKLQETEEKLKTLIFRQQFDLLFPRSSSLTTSAAASRTPSSRGSGNSRRSATASARAFGRPLNGQESSRQRSTT